MVFESETIPEDEIEEELINEEKGGLGVDIKKERVQEINQQIKTLLEERDFLEKEIEEMFEDIDED